MPKIKKGFAQTAYMLLDSDSEPSGNIQDNPVFENRGLRLWSQDVWSEAPAKTLRNSTELQTHEEFYLEVVSDEQVEKSVAISDEIEELESKRKKVKNLCRFLSVSTVLLGVAIYLFVFPFFAAIFASLIVVEVILEIGSRKIEPINEAIDEVEGKLALTTGLEPQNNDPQRFIQIPKKNSSDGFDFFTFLKVHAADDSPVASHIISAIKLKFEAGEATWTVMKWCRTVSTISQQDQSFPLDLIPVSNIDAMQVLEKIVEKCAENECAQQELVKERQGIAKEFLKNDSKALLEGAMRFLNDGTS